MFPAIFNALLSDIVQHVQSQELGGESEMEITNVVFVRLLIVLEKAEFSLT